MRPVIGIMPRSYYDKEFERNYLYVYENVRKMILDMGGIPLIITPSVNTDMYDTKFNEFPEENDLDFLVNNFYLNNIDGLFLPGGFKYTKFDLDFIDEAINKNIPILGVCLGAQSLSNYKKEYSLKPIESDVEHKSPLHTKYSHSVKIEKNTMLYDIIGKYEIMVNSFHRMQMTSNPLFKNAAFAEDGVLEAIEMKNKDFVVGVQWHPEVMYEYDLNSKKLLSYFIDKCKSYNSSKSKVVKL